MRLRNPLQVLHSFRARQVFNAQGQGRNEFRRREEQSEHHTVLHDAFTLERSLLDLLGYLPRFARSAGVVRMDSTALKGQQWQQPPSWSLFSQSVDFRSSGTVLEPAKSLDQQVAD